MSSSSFPDWRNLGVLLRVVLLLHLFAVPVLLAHNRDIASLGSEALTLVAFIEPVLLAGLLGLAGLDGLLRRLPAWMAWCLSLAWVSLCALGVNAFTAGDEGTVHPARVLFWALLACLALWAYFHVRLRVLGRGVSEARLMALTARIRPHFLFNSLNAVLGVIRDDPRRAERALEELSDLFRVLMRDNRELVTVSDEIELCRQYLALEDLRLGERLAVRWQIDCPLDARVPPLMLQPLVENAVYHGIEPRDVPGEVGIRLSRDADQLVVQVRNPVDRARLPVHGNRMALANIRERLMLFFDLEASLECDETESDYIVTLRMPLRTGATA